VKKLQTYMNDQLFFVDPDGDRVVFRVPCGGATTKGSGYPRCELREMKKDGEEAGWSTDDAEIHEMTLKLKIMKTPPVKKHVICAQIHDSEDDLMMVRLEGEKLFVERNSLNEVMLDRNYKLGTLFDLKIQASKGVISVWYNGQQKIDWTVSKDGCYFKAGCYTQSNVKKGDEAESFGEVVIQQLHIQQPDEEAKQAFLALTLDPSNCLSGVASKSIDLDAHPLCEHNKQVSHRRVLVGIVLHIATVLEPSTSDE
jgi:Alginate lyase